MGCIIMQQHKEKESTQTEKSSIKKKNVNFNSKNCARLQPIGFGYLTERKYH